MADTVIAELKPCPFCGGNALGPERKILRPGKSERPLWQIGCGTMFCFQMYRGSKKEAIAAWNTREAEAEVAALKAENERLTKIIEDSRMDLKGFDEETLAWFAAGGQKGK